MEEVVVENREWVLCAYADKGIPSSDHLQLRTNKLFITDDAIPNGHVAIQILWLSVDPYLRSRMSGLMDGLSLEQYQLNQVVTTIAVGRVISSKDSGFSKGDITLDFGSPVAEYSVVPAIALRKLDPDSKIPLPVYLSALGITGLSAWVGIELLGNPKPGENVFISSAAGGVGSVAGQLAKLKGCRVVGSAGSDEKVQLLKTEFGYDEAFNYRKETDFDAALTKYFPNGIDIYFDNVGGEMLEAVLNHVNKKARIPICGMISQYNQVWTERKGVRNLLNIVGKEVRMQGFMLASYWDRFGDFAMEMEGHIVDGKINSKHLYYNTKGEASSHPRLSTWHPLWPHKTSFSASSFLIDFLIDFSRFFFISQFDEKRS